MVGKKPWIVWAYYVTSWCVVTPIAIIVSTFTHLWQIKLTPLLHVRSRGGGTGSLDPPPVKTQGFLSNTGPDLLKNHKATKPAFNVGSSSTRQGSAGDSKILVVFGSTN